MPKKIESKLDQYAEQLLGMEAEKRTLAEMQKWLAAEGVSVAQSTVGRFLESLRSQRAQDRILQLVATGSRQVAEVEKSFASNPAPELATLIKLIKTLIFQLTVKGESDPKSLTLANNLTVTVCQFVSGQTKAEFKRVELEQAERKLQLAEKRAAQAEDTEKVLKNSELTDDQRAQRIKEIYGRA